MVVQKKAGEPKEVKKHRIVLSNLNREQLEINASHSILYKRFKEKLYDLPSQTSKQMQTEIRSSFFFKTDEALRKMIFEHDYPGYVWRRVE